MNRIELYEVVGLGRSGHHAFMNWIIHNLTGIQIEWKYKFTRIADTNFFVLDEGSHDVEGSFNYIQQNLKDISQLMVGYEESDWHFSLFSKLHRFVGPNSIYPVYDRPFDYKGRVLIIRDFFNILASRVKKNQDTGMNTFDVEEKFIEMWKNHARACVSDKVDFIKFEDWTSDESIRKKFLETKLNCKEIFGIDRVIGTKSSFDSRDKVHERYKQVQIPENIKELIKEDRELFYLMGRLGYNYRRL